MDATFAALVTGFFSVITILAGGIVVLHRQHDERRKDDDLFRAEMRLKVQSIESKLDNQYLLRDPHMEKHKSIEVRIEEHSKRLRALESGFGSARRGS